MKATGQTVTIEGDGPQGIILTNHVSLAPSPPTADHPQDPLPRPVPNTDTLLRSVEIPTPSGRAPPSSVAATPPQTVQKMRDSNASSIPPTRSISADTHGPLVSSDDGYHAYLPEKDDQWKTPVASRHDDCYNTYMPEHDDPHEYVVGHTVSAGLWENGEVRYELHWFGYGLENDQWEPRENLPPNFKKRCWAKIGRRVPLSGRARIPSHMFSD